MDPGRRPTGNRNADVQRTKSRFINDRNSQETIIMGIGYDQPLYILPFDHRGTFQKNMFGWTGTLTPSRRRRSPP